MDNLYGLNTYFERRMKKVHSYEIISTIGSGGMGVVYLAKHVLQNKVYALKSLFPQFNADPVTRQRFENEAVILSKLSHRNILQVFDFFEFEGSLFIVMEYIEGRSLAKFISSEIGPIPFQKALPIFLQILDGVEHAHQNDIIHRDIKPSNIIITNEPVVKVSDFGIAKSETQNKLTGTGTQLGTVIYMSPEQIRGESATKQSDIYSLGITLYEMLAGKTPFYSEVEIPEFRLMEMIVYQAIPDPRTFYPYIPQQLIDIINKAVSKEPAQRYNDVHELRAEILSFLHVSSSASEATAEHLQEELYKAQVYTNPPTSKMKETSEYSTHSTPSTSPIQDKPGRRSYTPFVVIFGVLIILGIVGFFLKDRLFNKKLTLDKSDTLIIFAQKQDMALIETGQYMMGSNLLENEKPIHQVVLDSFWMDKNEITVLQYKEFCNSTKTKMPTEPSWGWRDDYPIVNVSWHDANNYAKWAGKRLPTEAEWEYAARGAKKGSGARYSGGANLDILGWVFDNAGFCAHPVKTKKPNELGLFDLSGNVWEWCTDGFVPTYPNEQSVTNPVIQGEELKVIRGGSWFFDETSARVTNRRGEQPDTKNFTIGFRCVVSRK